jgi:long-chain acyl-CoA synthetase
MSDKELLGGIAKILKKGSKDPNAIRFHVPNGQGGFVPVTWGEYLARSRAVALCLNELGVGAGDKVAVFATTRIEWSYCCAGIEACRAVFVPVYFSSTAKQTHFIVEHSDSKVLFTELALLPRVLERWRDYDKLERVVVWDLEDSAQLEQLVDGANALNPALELSLGDVAWRVLPFSTVLDGGFALAHTNPYKLAEMVARMQPSDVAAIIYTSGTTGDPKGVVLTGENLAASTRSWYAVLAHAFPPLGQRRDILWLPVSHMSGWGILGQGTLFDYETWLSNPLELLALLPKVKPTMLLSVPAYWEKMYAAARAASNETSEQYAALHRITGGELSFLLSGGAGLETEVKQFFYDAGIQMIEGYGLTECAPNVTMNRLDDFDFESVGKPVPNVEVRLAEDGEVLVRGENVFGGYYKQPEQTREVLDDEGFFHTGDLGAWTDRGFLRFVGRKKEIIVTAGGKNVAPAAIESKFAGRPHVEHAVVYGDERKYLVALITPNEATLRSQAKKLGIQKSSLDELLKEPAVIELVQKQVDAVNGQLARFETIKKFYLHPGQLTVEEGHLTPSLKLRRKNVWQRFSKELDALYR